MRVMIRCLLVASPVLMLTATAFRLPSYRAGDGVSSPRFFAVRHAESVANVVRRDGELAKRKRDWLDDSIEHGGNDRYTRRLRDALLSKTGFETASAASDTVLADIGDDKVLLIVSPMTRTILTAVLLYHKLPPANVRVVVEPSVREIMNAPLDITENMGRNKDQVFPEAEAFLKHYMQQDPKHALALLDRIKDAFPEGKWWFEEIRSDNLPKRVFEDGMDKRRKTLVKKVQEHVDGIEVARVYIVCHWGVIYTIEGEKNNAKNLEEVEFEGFLSSNGTKGTILPKPMWKSKT